MKDLIRTLGPGLLALAAICLILALADVLDKKPDPDAPPVYDTGYEQWGLMTKNGDIKIANINSLTEREKKAILEAGAELP